MWVYSKSRGEHDNRFMLNLDQAARINISQLGEKWFVEAIVGSDSFPLAATGSQEDAQAVMKHLLDSLKAGERALDLDAPEEKPPDQRPAVPPAPRPEAHQEQPPIKPEDQNGEPSPESKQEHVANAR